MQDMICQAIREKRLLELEYDGHVRRVAPHIYGIDATGEELLSCYQVWGSGESGEPAGWKSFKLADVSQLKLTTKRFAPRPEYGFGERAIARVFCQI
jgi:hypothetical protein